MQLLPTDQSSSLTQKGQVTIPIFLRDMLGLIPGDRVSFEADTDFIKLKPIKSSLQSVYGSVKPLKGGISFKKMRRIALEDKLNAIR
ncbi:MAG: hypothetical protein UU32_C0002G0015 [Candidatus Woesebacteria bacterium GW2011_GWB1_41_10]|uniref:SpoVT-AbrB domain-containing protein n=1 Tax=Candidatus Woesebacteria bacterium GW2011_GWB1_41_10 TaxID=1618577 RepID=A0A0G0WU67_9BACT|nr:MAG: hypothetical protein UU32_C0002G0015 [Candidatus Woesebacteria bacterium GW2011_GWB1_41_10]